MALLAFSSEEPSISISYNTRPFWQPWHTHKPHLFALSNDEDRHTQTAKIATGLQIARRKSSNAETRRLGQIPERKPQVSEPISSLFSPGMRTQRCRDERSVETKSAMERIARKLSSAAPQRRPQTVDNRSIITRHPTINAFAVENKESSMLSGQTKNTPLTHQGNIKSLNTLLFSSDRNRSNLKSTEVSLSQNGSPLAPTRNPFHLIYPRTNCVELSDSIRVHSLLRPRQNAHSKMYVGKPLVIRPNRVPVEKAPQESTSRHVEGAADVSLSMSSSQLTFCKSRVSTIGGVRERQKMVRFKDQSAESGHNFVRRPIIYSAKHAP